MQELWRRRLRIGELSTEKDSSSSRTCPLSEQMFLSNSRKQTQKVHDSSCQDAPQRPAAWKRLYRRIVESITNRTSPPPAAPFQADAPAVSPAVSAAPVTGANSVSLDILTLDYKITKLAKTCPPSETNSCYHFRSKASPSQACSQTFCCFGAQDQACSCLVSSSLHASNYHPRPCGIRTSHGAIWL